MNEQEQFFEQLKSAGTETLANYLDASPKEVEQLIETNQLDASLANTYAQMPDDEQNAFLRVIRGLNDEANNQHKFAIGFFLGAGGTKLELLNKHADGKFVGHSLYGSLCALTQDELGALLFVKS